MYIGLSEKVRLVDRLTIEKYGVDSLTLMHNAAACVFDAIVQQDISMKTICILCGKGNNAGDGFALAAMLSKYAHSVSVVLLCGKNFTTDAQHYFDNLPKEVRVIENQFICADIYVDAVFGTGFSGDLPDNVSNLFHKIDLCPAQKVSIDIPSGVNADTGECSSYAFKADITVTFEILKFAHILPTANDFCGSIQVKNIGLSIKAIDEVGFDIELLDRYILSDKCSNLHKGRNGTLYSIVGCKKYQGAATLATKAALRGGCGIVSVFIPESIYGALSAKVDSAVIHSCPENDCGMHSSSSITTIADEIEKRIPDAILVGSGMGAQNNTREIVEYVLQQPVNCIVDGDGLRYVSSQYLKNRNYGTVLTPHLGEFARMVKRDISYVQRHRFALSRAYAIENNCVLVLKDSVTVISTLNGMQWVLACPNAGMAKGGSGDVLAGLIASFLAQGFSPEQAAKAGVWYHSAAGKSALKQFGEYAMLPEDVVSELKNVLNIKK